MFDLIYICSFILNKLLLGVDPSSKWTRRSYFDAFRSLEDATGVVFNETSEV